MYFPIGQATQSGLQSVYGSPQFQAGLSAGGAMGGANPFAGGGGGLAGTFGAAGFGLGGPVGGAIGAGLGVLGDVVGGLRGEHMETKRRRLSRKRGLRQIRQYMRPMQELYGQRMENQLQQALQARIGGYDEALQQTDLLGRQAFRQARDVATQQAGGLTSGLVSSGLYGTSRAGIAQRGVQADLMRRIQDITAGLAGTRAQLYTQRGQAEATGRSALARFYGGRGRQEQGLQQMAFNLLTAG